jgi:3-oxoacyl-[acyl-carrier protein] reductase
MRLKGKIALITGSAQGLGAAIAKKFAQEGAQLIINDINNEKAEIFSKELENLGYTAIPLAADVSNAQQVDTMIEKTIKRFGSIDILVNNAGISYKTMDGFKIPLLEIPENQWDRVLAVNLKGMFLCAQKAAKFMMEKKYGQIVNMASTAATLGSSGPAGNHYMASKAGVISLTKSLAFDLVDYNIRVNCVAPGFIKTELAGKSNKNINKAAIERIAMKRFGTPKEVAEAVLFLASDSSSYITGETLIVDGGFISNGVVGLRSI